MHGMKYSEARGGAGASAAYYAAKVLVFRWRHFEGACVIYSV